MRIIALNTLKQFWEQPAYRKAEQPLVAWAVITRKSVWEEPADIKRSFNTADILKRGRVIFDIGGNKFRIVAHVNYRRHIVYIRFVGTHQQYEAIDPETI